MPVQRLEQGAARFQIFRPVLLDVHGSADRRFQAARHADTQLHRVWSLLQQPVRGQLVQLGADGVRGARQDRRIGIP